PTAVGEATYGVENVAPRGPEHANAPWSMSLQAIGSGDTLRPPWRCRSRHSSEDPSCAERRPAITRAKTRRVPIDDEPSLERRPVVCRETTSRPATEDPWCAERCRAIPRAKTRRVPRDDEPSLERRPVVCREMTSHHSSEDPSCAYR